jgi:PhnB protein
MKTSDYPALSPYLIVHDGAAAVAFYTEALGAEERYRLVDSATGKIGHAELYVQGQLFMLAGEHPDWAKSPRTLGGTAVKLSLMVEDPDAAFARAVAAGAEALMQPQDQFYGFRCASVRDPFGHEWMFQREIEKVSPEEMQRRWDAMVTGCDAEGKS